MARVALDVMGGDFAPDAPIAGALLAALDSDGTASHTIQFVGRPEVIRERLDALLAREYAHARAHAERFEIVPATDVVEMSEKPTAALRGKPNSSMAVGLKLQAEGKSDAFVSAGNTGAQMALSSVILRLHPGLKRPAISTFFPTAREPVVVLDSGANVDCSADELVQFARLGAVYAEDLLGRTNPVIGLLSIGEEPEKGNAVVKEAHALLRESGLNFQGNIEGRDLPAGASDRGPFDVVVCDGFVGNIMLKSWESLVKFFSSMLKEELQANPVRATGALLSKGAFNALKERINPDRYGGAPLLGLNGNVLKTHGSSNRRAIKSAISAANEIVKADMNQRIEADIARANELLGQPAFN